MGQRRRRPQREEAGEAQPRRAGAQGPAARQQREDHRGARERVQRDLLGQVVGLDAEARHAEGAREGTQDEAGRQDATGQVLAPGHIPPHMSSVTQTES
jgi:hypothetical protein